MCAEQKNGDGKLLYRVALRATLGHCRYTYVPTNILIVHYLRAYSNTHTVLVKTWAASEHFF